MHEVSVFSAPIPLPSAAAIKQRRYRLRKQFEESGHSPLYLVCRECSEPIKPSYRRGFVSPELAARRSSRGSKYLLSFGSHRPSRNYLRLFRPKFMPRQLTDYNVDRINELIQLAGCPMCLGLACVCSEGAPLGDGQCGFPIKYPNPIQCTRNRYHICTVEVCNSHYFALRQHHVPIGSPMRTTNHADLVFNVVGKREAFIDHMLTAIAEQVQRRLGSLSLAATTTVRGS